METAKNSIWAKIPNHLTSPSGFLEIALHLLFNDYGHVIAANKWLLDLQISKA